MRSLMFLPWTGQQQRAAAEPLGLRHCEVALACLLILTLAAQARAVQLKVACVQMRLRRSMAVNASNTVAYIASEATQGNRVEVIPDPDRALATREYGRQMNLAPGSPLATWWSLLDGPADARVDVNGRISGRTPPVGEIGDLRRFEVQAANLDGSDTEVWYVRILSRADLDEDGDVDQSDFGLFQVCLSGTGEAYESGCSGADLDNDTDVDRHDFDAFAGCIAGSDSMPKG